MTLDDSVIFVRKWFKDNNVEIPKGAVEWRNRKVKDGSIPPKFSYDRIKKNLNITIGNFIKLLNEEEIRKIPIPITSDNISDDLGLQYLKDKLSESNHKKIFVKCNNCGYEEWLDYGTLSRMKKRGNKYCRICRDVGGKEKPKEIYDKFENFSIVQINSNSTITYNCDTCNKDIIRGMGHSKNSDYLVCEYCNPNMVGAKIRNKKYGSFDSNIELLIYIELLRYFDKEEIKKQKSYHNLYNTNTKHTADFYIPKLDIVIEATTKGNGIPRYNETKDWKLNLSNNVYFVYSKQDVSNLMLKLGVKEIK